jgi:hypothetical protein
LDAKEMTAHIYIRDGFWAAKGQPDLLSVETVTADVRRQRISMTPFGQAHRLDFDMATDRVTIRKADDGTGSGLARCSSPQHGRPCPRREVVHHADRLLHGGVHDQQRLGQVRPGDRCPRRPRSVGC